MASSTKLPIVLFFACSLFLQGTLAEVVCENLGKEQCAYAVSSTGKRCMLEEDKCTTSDIVVEGLTGYIETDQCVKACGLDRVKVVESSSEFLTAKFVDNLCAPPCYENCPNILEYYFNLADGEGVFLPALCDPQKNNHRTMAELFTTSSVAASPKTAPGPKGAASPKAAPGPKSAAASPKTVPGPKSAAASPKTAPGPKSAAAPAPAPFARKAPAPGPVAAASVKVAVEDSYVDDYTNNNLEY